MRSFISKVVLAAVFLGGGAAVAARASGQSPASGPLSADIARKVEAFLRAWYAWGSDYVVKVEAPVPSRMPDLYRVPVEVLFKGQSEQAVIYVSADGRFIIRGALDELVADPFAANRALLHLEGHPFVGPANACVNVVEFSDYECPHCRVLYQALKQIEFRYPQVRFTFMDYPIVQIHAWAMSAARIARCAYHQKPADYAKIQQAFFENQDQVTQAGQEHAVDKLLDLASQAGFNADTLRVCMASSDVRLSVDSDLELAKKLDVTSTPTLFIDGRPLVGANDQTLEQFLSYESSLCRPPF